MFPRLCMLFLSLEILTTVPGSGAILTRGPFIQNATTNSIQVLWKTLTPASTFVEYGPSPALGAILTNAALLTNHLATLSNLTPNATYFYRAGSADTGGQILTDLNSFHTLKTAGGIRFQVVGDTPGRDQTASPDAIAVAKAMRSETTDLVLHCGDLNYYGYLDLEFFDVFQPQMKTVPYFLVIGNHDIGGTDLTGVAFQEMFSLPTNSATGTEQFYSFDHGDVHFVGLFNPWFQAYRFTSSTVQFQWLTNDLAATTKPWKVIFLHFPVATSAIHASDDYNYNSIPDHVEMMQLLAPVAQRQGVQVMFGSHDHDYERFAPTNGFHYFVVGGGGRGLYDLSIQHPASAQFWKTYQFLRVSVTNETMLVESINTNGFAFDSISITRTNPESRLWPSSWNTPTVESGTPNDSDGNINGQSFDFTGPPIPALTGQFSNLGRFYVNNDDANLYLGFQEAAFYRGNNIFLFIQSPRQTGVSTMAGLGNGFVDPVGQGVDGLDCLENLSFLGFAPSIGCLLGDEYADTQSRAFARSNLTLNIGQGIFYLDPQFTDVPGARLQQYNRSPQTNHWPMTQTGVNKEQNADYIELAIPYSSLGDLRPSDIVAIGAVVGGTTYDPSSQTRQLDSGFLGETLSPAAQGNFTLAPVRVRLAGNPADLDWDGDGLPNDWELAHSLDPYSAQNEDGALGDPDQDGMSNAAEQVAGTHPRDPASSLRVTLTQAESILTLTWAAVPGKRYTIQASRGSLTEFEDLSDPNLPRVATSTIESYQLDAASPGCIFYRLRLVP